MEEPGEVLGKEGLLEKKPTTKPTPLISGGVNVQSLLRYSQTTWRAGGRRLRKKTCYSREGEAGRRVVGRKVLKKRLVHSEKKVAV